ncbi:hypothetical protein BJ912DRAFT_277270 [Pholiota molesta]|nr:hypothetical protein BJ912DRAFT_277270 [Pholiota molesta]
MGRAFARQTSSIAYVHVFVMLLFKSCLVHTSMPQANARSSGRRVRIDGHPAHEMGVPCAELRWRIWVCSLQVNAVGCALGSSTREDRKGVGVRSNRESYGRAQAQYSVVSAH